MLAINWSDVWNVVSLVLPHLIAIVVALIVMIAVIVAVMKQPKPLKRLIRGEALSPSCPQRLTAYILR